MPFRRLGRLTSHGPRRRLHDGGVWGRPFTIIHEQAPTIHAGYQTPKELELPDFTPRQLLNRAKQPELVRLVDMYRVRPIVPAREVRLTAAKRHAHRTASLDPLGLTPRPPVPALDPRRYGFDLSEGFLATLPASNLSSTLPEGGPLAHLGDESKPWQLDGVVGVPVRSDGNMRLGDIVKTLEQIYGRELGYEFMHMPNKHAREWFAAALESLSLDSPRCTAEERRRFWRLLARSELFDRWLAKKFPNVKRYGLEGAESMLVALDWLWEVASRAGVEQTVISMPHRGRLNLLTGLLGFDLPLLMRKLRGKSEIPETFLERGATGDVLSHLFGTSTLTTSSHRVHLLPNPSHLEAVAPVGLGYARGLQVPLDRSEDGYELGDKVLSVQVHGDAAFEGQGVCSETLQLSSLPHFNVGGSIHLVVNNQLGYTTSAIQGRSSFYATDLGKSIGAPVVHVNGEHPEAVARAMALAFAYQQKFRKDVLVDLVVYRRWGHNELDEPTYTSPHMYRKITSLKTVPAIYEALLIDDGAISRSEVEDLTAVEIGKLDEALAVADAGYEPPMPPMKGQWQGVVYSGPGIRDEVDISPATGVQTDVLAKVGQASVTTPADFNVHPRLTKMHIQRRLDSLSTGENIDFATAEALAFGTLMLEGRHVRICGQDSGRGTFSQRHALVADQQVEGRSIVPLNHNIPRGGRLEVVNSPLSEFAVMGFEVGVSWTTPDILPIWEAQFGDFGTGAQIILDTFFASSEAKWLLQSALTLLLPHGQDGAGPEHSSSRPERFLQLSSESADRDASWTPNVHVCNPSTPAQMFHVLRRQLVRPYRKPLVVMSPKGILRLREASSKLADMGPGTTWQPVLDDPSVDKDKVQRVVICSGKTYYDLVKNRPDDRVAIVRLEEISPFPYSALARTVGSYTKAESLIWAQEEPENAGAQAFVAPKLPSVSSLPLRLVSRPGLATPAIGVGTAFKAEQRTYEDAVFAGL